jgi:transcriptional regulator with XRE-family HTH domain
MGTNLVSDFEAAGLTRHQALRAALASSGIRQYVLAKRLGISEGELSKILAGRRPLSDERLAQIDTALGELTA